MKEIKKGMGFKRHKKKAFLNKPNQPNLKRKVQKLKKKLPPDRL